MYKSTPTSYIYSPSDLTRFMRSPFADWVTRLQIEKPEELGGIEKDKDALLGLQAKQGTDHEKKFLDKLMAEYGAENVAVIAADRQTAYAETIKAMQSGYKVIFQAYLKRDNFAGFADFLIKNEGKSSLGDYYYEVWDTKRSKSTKPYFVVQLCCYSWMLEEVQGKLPEEIVVVLGNQIQERMRIAAYYSYFQSLKQQFLSAHEQFTGDVNSMPDPALCKDFGEWSSYAKQLMDKSDSLALVANIRKTQIKKLKDAGIQTLSDLANSSVDEVKGVKPEILSKIKAQAKIQLQSKGSDKPSFQVLNSDKGKGLTALPSQSGSDIFFDIEGHPLLDGGLEYLWGVSYYDTEAQKGKDYAFKDWWAHDQEQEKLAFQDFINWVYLRWQKDPSMHVYHYASYEITAIRKLSQRYQTHLNEVAELLLKGVFIDLYKIVKNGLLIGEPKYSIKNVEHLYRGRRTTEVVSGGDSVVAYEDWREQGGVEDWSQLENGYLRWRSTPENFDWTLWPELKAIRDYNIDDCESTLELVNWLRQLQKANGIGYHQPQANEREEVEQTTTQINNAAKRKDLEARQEKLINWFESDLQLKQDPKAELLASLLHYYDRERKPKAWAYYDRMEKSEDELFDDDTVVHDLNLTNLQTENGKLLCTATYNRDQPIRTDKIRAATVQGHDDVKVSNIKFIEIDLHQGQIIFNIDSQNQEILKQKPFTLFGNEDNINTDTLENRLCDITEHYFNSKKLPGALDTLFEQANPKFYTSSQYLPITRERYADNTDYLDAIANAVQAMDQTCLCIQGPPGSGKTHTAKYVITKLVNQEKRVGIMANNHDAIMNLLAPLSRDLPAKNMIKIAGFASQIEFEKQYPKADFPGFDFRGNMKFTKKQPYSSFKAIGATAFAFANETALEAPLEAPLDYLFVDEASQLSLAHLVAASGAADNIVLMGDQMQLEQPTQASHPGQSGASALDFMLQNHKVIPEDKGIFLERTYRMHPAICQPLSEVVYEGKLQAVDANHNQAVTITQPKLITKANGILKVAVAHEGNTRCSIEETNIIQQLVDELKMGNFTDKHGNTKPITDQDIMVIAPYNMQVNLLKEKLKGDLKIGTIDKFQGQETPIAIISMATSDVDGSPRGLDFIFDIKRLNVAISRAKALAIVVANQNLEQCQIQSLQQMEKVGFFCKF